MFGWQGQNIDVEWIVVIGKDVLNGCFYLMEKVCVWLLLLLLLIQLAAVMLVGWRRGEKGCCSDDSDERHDGLFALG